MTKNLRIHLCEKLCETLLVEILPKFRETLLTETDRNFGKVTEVPRNAFFPKLINILTKFRKISRKLPKLTEISRNRFRVSVQTLVQTYPTLYPIRGIRKNIKLRKLSASVKPCEPSQNIINVFNFEFKILLYKTVGMLRKRKFDSKLFFSWYTYGVQKCNVKFFKKAFEVTTHCRS